MKVEKEIVVKYNRTKDSEDDVITRELTRRPRLRLKEIRNTVTGDELVFVEDVNYKELFASATTLRNKIEIIAKYLRLVE